MTTDQVLDLVVKVEEPLFQLIDEMKKDLDIIKCLKENNQVKFVIVLIKNHRQLVYEILAKMEDTTIEDIANRDLQRNINTIQNLVELKGFF